jgi:hypothetical protein
MRSSYKAGCGCDLCKQAEAAYRRELRQRRREAVGEFVTRAVPGLSLVTGGGTGALTCGNAGYAPANSVEAAVLLEIEGLGVHPRPGLEAACLALARVLDNPKATSTKPAAAAKLAHILDMLCKSTVTKPRLASVRRMTKSRD